LMMPPFFSKTDQFWFGSSHRCTKRPKHPRPSQRRKRTERFRLSTADGRKIAPSFSRD
jgi:hypothetical protein